MFTGIIKELGKVVKINKKSFLWEILILSEKIYEEVSPSESISVNGVCLTLTKKKDNILYFEVMKPTLEKTNLKRVRVNSVVNLESSLKFCDKVNGHFVLGHIDCETPIRNLYKYKDYSVWEINFLSSNRKFLVSKGSIAIDGISLTIDKVYSQYFTINVTPYTKEHTNLKYRKVNDWVNLEFDYLAKIFINSGAGLTWFKALGSGPRD